MSKFHALKGAFKRVPHIFTVMVLAAAIMVPSMIAAVGDTSEQLTYTTGSPCAAFDTRFWDTNGDGTSEAKPVGKVGGVPQELSFYVTGTGEEANRLYDFWPDSAEVDEAHQGGSQAGAGGDPAGPSNGNNLGCGVPATAETILLNLEAISPAGDGNLQAYPPGGTPGGVLIYDSNVFGASNALILEIDNTPEVEGAADGELKIGVNGPAVHVRGSVVGYTCPSTGCGT